MHWKERRGRLYLYRSVRVGGRVRSEYVGTGGDAALIDQLDTAYRDRADLKKHDRKQLDGKHLEQERPIQQYCEQAQDTVARYLEARGFHRHERSAWRKRRYMDTVAERATTSAAAFPEPLARNYPDLVAQIRAGNMAALAVSEMVELVSNKDCDRIDAHLRRIVELAAELAGPHPSPIERLLAEQAAICWFDLNWLAFLCARPELMSNNHFDRRRDRAHRRYMTFLRSLASVRKLVSVYVDLRDTIGGDPLESRHRATQPV